MPNPTGSSREYTGLSLMCVSESETSSTFQVNSESSAQLSVSETYDTDDDVAPQVTCGSTAKEEILSGQVVWITGASSGIGEFLAYELAECHCKLVLSARREDELARVKEECLRRSMLTENDILVLPMDVTVTSRHQEMFQQVLDHFGKLDVLVNNAGRSQRAQWECIDLEVDQQLFLLNVFSVVALTRVVIPHFLEQNKGHVVVMSSAAGKIGVPGSASYTGSKHALHGYMECLRAEKASINITILCPGPVFSNLLQEAFTDKPNEVYGQIWGSKDRRMATDRCARLCAIAIANKVDEAWIAPYPFIAVFYAYQYCPGLTKRVMRKLGVKSMMKMRDGTVTLSMTQLDDKAKDDGVKGDEVKGGLNAEVLAAK